MSLTQEQIVEGNKAICEFMGLKISDDLYRHQLAPWVACNGFNLDYHSDWRSLMVVVEKIGQLHSSSFPVRIQMDGNKTIGFSIWVDGQYYGSGAEVTYIETIWQQVVAFITWYQSQNKINQ